MSRGFVKEDDQEELPIIPPRAALPSEMANYVTPKGMQDLIAEKDALEEEKASLSQEDEAQHRRESTFIQGKLNLLQDRIDTARVVKPSDQTQDEVRFGATVTYKMKERKAQFTFQIVGVDEADIKKKKIAFVSPIASAIIGSKVGEIIDFQLGDEERQIEILKIKY